MGAAEQLDTDHVIALGVRCERSGSSVYYVGRVGQFTVRLTLLAPDSVELTLSASSERDFPSLLGFGETLEEAERYLERALRARAERLAEASQIVAANEPVSAEEECGRCAVCREHQRQEAEHTYAELRGYR